MLYELIAVVRPGNITEVKDIAVTVGKLVLNTSGVVRGITNWGPFLLTKPVHKHQANYDSGHHFIMRFDCSPATKAVVTNTLVRDPRMIRIGCVKMGTTLQQIKDTKGQVEWRKGGTSGMSYRGRDIQ